MSPAWAPLAIFPAVVSQVAYWYVASSKRHQTRLAFVAEASRVLSLSLDARELIASTARLALPTFGDAALAVLRDGEHHFDTVAQAEMDENEVRVDTSTRATSPLAVGAAQIAYRVLTTHPADATDAQTPGQEVHAFTEVGPLGSYAAVPIQSATHTFGALVVASGAKRAYTRADLEILEELARRSAAALENARLHADAQRAAQIRDEFLSIAAHELKTPVTSLRGYAQLLLRSGPDTDPSVVNRGLHTIDHQSRKLSQLTTKLLDVSRIDAGKLALDFQETDLAALLRVAVATVADGAPQHTLELDAPRTCCVSIDPIRMEQVIGNLLSNAIKFSPDGGHIHVALAESSADSSVRLEVRDHGVGIPVDRRANLFERLYQAHGDGYLSGLGLGLYISSQLVQLHGGHIEAQFPEEGGTAFVVTLPAHEAPSHRSD
jgi:signal transduction histidine kinase